MEQSVLPAQGKNANDLEDSGGKFSGGQTVLNEVLVCASRIFATAILASRPRRTACILNAARSSLRVCTRRRSLCPRRAAWIFTAAFSWRAITTDCRARRPRWAAWILTTAFSWRNCQHLSRARRPRSHAWILVAAASIRASRRRSASFLARRPRAAAWRVVAAAVASGAAASPSQRDEESDPAGFVNRAVSRASLFSCASSLTFASAIRASLKTAASFLANLALSTA
mmetsp:Transcript_9557/g.24421  ORF Transcript_9557/g.24421 Transcript_9557/m.24421 type:complete len:228 (+) Transcript_9557:605-1288(+)